MKHIQLTQGQVAIVDDEDYDELSRFSWYVDNKGYAQRNQNEVTPRTTIRMHQQILGVIPGMQIDHLNRNRLDNQRTNLRYISPVNQARNVGMKKNNSSGFKGVSWWSKTGKWRAYITFERKPITIGYFFAKVDAARAYDEKAKELFGQYALTNEQLGNFNK